MGLPYRTILTLASVLLAGRFAMQAEASPGCRWAVGGLTVASLWLQGSDLFAVSVASVLMQLAVCLFILLRQKAMIIK
jgi:hypothetical protein